jgi:hypothetical protein
MNPLALMAWEYGPMACGASLVEMISRIKFSSQLSALSSQKKTTPQRAQGHTRNALKLPVIGV